ncbi:MAG: alpha/beta hydrolase [Betaproteobacteria bacterium HGW-Betaproteobacteria-18]|nr:MAG: alpha/beta hydrolase [Betaproteobacteria bacterium HGW-Betaproteobacteria-18]
MAIQINFFIRVLLGWNLRLAHRVVAVFLRLGLVLALLSTSGCAWLDGYQRQLIYRPTSGVPADFTGLRAGDERYVVSLPGAGAPQHIAIWWLPHATPDAPTLLYLHGTFRNLFENMHKIDALRAAGYSVLAVDYRGWGESSPITPSESTITQDAGMAWAELKKHQPIAKKRVIYGHSMGSGVAVDLASRLNSPMDYGGLVLESAFTNFTDVAHASGWLASLINLFNRERFAALEKIGQVQAPLLMLHGKRDDTVPIHLGERLFAAANSPKQWLAMDNAAHSDLDLVNPALYQATLQDFAASYLAIR